MSTLLQTCGKAKVLLATPCHGDLTAEYTLALFETAQQIDCDLIELAGHCHVDDARNSIVRTFLQGPWERLVFIDADVSWKAKDLRRLLSHDVDVVAGAYPLKQDEPKYPVQWLEAEAWADRRGLIEVKSAATGMMAIKRNVLEDIAAVSPSFVFKAGDSKVTHEIFNRTIMDGVRIGGDVHFCYKWRDLGGSVYLDPNMTMGHTGTKTWEGNVGFFLKCGERSALEVGFDLLKSGTVDEWVFKQIFESWGNDYAAGPCLLSACYHLAREADGPILEFGSGLSSLVMAAANPIEDVWAIEYDQEWGDKCSEWAARLGLDNLKVINAPLVDDWYNWTSTRHFGLCLVDGPSRKIGNRGNCKLPEADTYIFDDAGDAPIMKASKKLAQAKDYGHVQLNQGHDRSFVIVHSQGGGHEKAA